MKHYLTICCAIVATLIVASAASADEIKDEIKIDHTVRECMTAGAVFGRGSVCYVSDIKTEATKTVVQLCGGLSVGLGAGAFAEGHALYCVTITIPGRVSREEALRRAESDMHSTRFFQQLRAEDERWRKFEESLQKMTIVVPEQNKARALDALVDEITTGKSR